MAKNHSIKGHTELTSNYFYSRDHERVGSHYILELRLDDFHLTPEERRAIADELYTTYKSIKEKLGIE